MPDLVSLCCFVEKFLTDPPSCPVQTNVAGSSLLFIVLLQHMDGAVLYGLNTYFLWYFLLQSTIYNFKNNDK